MNKNYADVLESMMIPAMETGGECITRVNFFNKDWNVNVEFDGCAPTTDLNKNLSKFIRSAPAISKKIESEFCRICNLFNEDPSYTGIPAGSIKSYSDIRDLSVKHITVYRDHKDTKCVVIILQGEYVIDDEHGWSIGITTDGMWDGTIRQYSSDYYDYLEDDGYQKHQKSKTVKVF